MQYEEFKKLAEEYLVKHKTVEFGSLVKSYIKDKNNFDILNKNHKEDCFKSCVLGYIFEYGFHGDKDFSKAVELYQRASDLNYPEA